MHGNSYDDQSDKVVLLVGATGGVGQAFLEQLNMREDVSHVFATYRNNVSNHDVISATNLKITWVRMDVASESSIKTAIAKIAECTSHLDWVINAVGLLYTDTHQPEKTIRHLEPEFFLQNMQINALPSLLLAKHIKALLKSAQRDEYHPAIFATMSARVGSISDNQLGGWYSYRMSKTALNMGMKTLAIEWGRSLKNVCVVVLQPGTVNTNLSKPFQKNVADDKLFTPAKSATKLIEVLNGLQAKDSGRFLDWAGQEIGW